MATSQLDFYDGGTKRILTPLEEVEEAQLHSDVVYSLARYETGDPGGRDLYASHLQADAAALHKRAVGLLEYLHGRSGVTS